MISRGRQKPRLCGHAAYYTACRCMHIHQFLARSTCIQLYFIQVHWADIQELAHHHVHSYRISLRKVWCTIAPECKAFSFIQLVNHRRHPA